MSGLGLQPEFAEYDAELKFDLGHIRADEPAECRAGEVLRGKLKPHECAAFGTLCTPERTLGAPMGSTEGACAAYFTYGRFRQEAEQRQAEQRAEHRAARAQATAYGEHG